MFDIIQSSETKAIEMATYLVKNKFAFQTHIDTNKIINVKTGKKKNTFRLFFITKSLLFDVIEKDIIKNFYTDDMLIYAMPVSHISQQFSDEIKLNVRPI